MKRSVLVGCAIVALGIAGCAKHGQLAIRLVPGTIAQGARPVTARIAEANGQYALGNVALALESYRKALRDDPASIDAMSGMAACYERMGRFDLSDRLYEAALALAPADPTLLGALAASMVRQGRPTEAAAIHREMAMRAANVSGTIVTLALPVARPVASEATQATPKASPREQTSRSLPLELAVVPLQGTHLERLSLGEVALVTHQNNRRGGPLAPKLAQSSLLALQAQASLARAVQGNNERPLLVLNAARQQGIAARTGRYLAGRGFPAARIGDAPRVRATSIIIAPIEDRGRALRLARALPVAPRTILGTRFTLLVGRDATASTASPG